MENVNCFNLAFEDLFTNKNKEEYLKIFNNPNLGVVQLKTDVPICVIDFDKASNLTKHEKETVPIVIYIDAEALTDQLSLNLNAEKNSSLVLHKAAEIAILNQCKVVRQLFKIH